MVAFSGVVRFRDLGVADYHETWRAMRKFCDSRDADVADEVWLLQHPPVYTLGQAGDPAHLLRENGIPLIGSDRGGQITYHGPGQLVAYLLLDLRRRGWGPRRAVHSMEEAGVATLAEFGIRAETRPDAPGVYAGGKKIGAVGLRVRRGSTYHGMSLNVDMDLSPFADINPCGYAGMQVAQIADFAEVSLAGAQAILVRQLGRALEKA